MAALVGLFVAGQALEAVIAAAAGLVAATFAADGRAFQYGCLKELLAALVTDEVAEPAGSIGQEPDSFLKIFAESSSAEQAEAFENFAGLAGPVDYIVPALPMFGWAQL